MKTLDEIYTIYTLLHLWNPLLHRSESKNSAKFRQTFSHVYGFTWGDIHGERNRVWAVAVGAGGVFHEEAAETEE